MTTTELAASKPRVRLYVGALGVVFGDIGTSPLYAMRECFHDLPATVPHVYGVASLIFWALSFTISVKYVLYVMRADNHDEGGILALMALALGGHGVSRPIQGILTLLGMAGAALLYGDGVITPAISVMSAVEGVSLMSSHLAGLSIPLSCLILVFLFSFQHHGTGGVGSVFGPVMVVWFTVLAVLGIQGIASHPEIVGALNPSYAIEFILKNPGRTLSVLGSVFLVVTGGEALYADMGHFGRSIISRAWYLFVGPALLLNYLGQGAHILEHPEAVEQPFFALAPEFLLGPLVMLSTCAAVIASQALISGAFSLTQQAVMLGLLPRVKIEHTSADSIGQVYVPLVNWALLFSTLILVASFGSSSRLAAAYGVAVAATMIFTTLLAAFAYRVRFSWNLWTIAAVTLIFLVVDLGFFWACAGRISQGGWVPLMMGSLLLLLMGAWRAGRARMLVRLKSMNLSLEDFFEIMRIERPVRVPGVGVFMTGMADGAPLALLRNLQHNWVVHRAIILLTIRTDGTPTVEETNRLEITEHPEGFTRVIYHVGFMERPRPASVLPQVTSLSVTHTTFYFNRDTVEVSDEHPFWTRVALGLYVALFRNETRAPGFFELPSERVIEMGGRIEL